MCFAYVDIYIYNIHTSHIHRVKTAHASCGACLDLHGGRACIADFSGAVQQRMDRSEPV